MKLKWCLTALLALPCSLFPVPSQNAFAEISEEEARVEMVENVEDLRRTEEVTSAALRARRDKLGWLFDYGGNSSFGYTASNDNDRVRTTPDSQDHSWDYELNLFAVLASVDRQTKFYFRTHTQYTETKKNAVSIRGNDFDNPKIDMMYFEKSFKRAAKHTLTVGRQYTQVGRGISYGLTADGIHWKTKGRKMELKALFMRQKPGDNNIDSLAPGSGRTKRLFFGAEYGHTIRKWLGASVYALWNVDRNWEDPYSTGTAGETQRSQFDSQFYGFVFDGTLFTKLKYWSEFIMMKGKTYDAASATNLTAKKVNLDAEAMDLGLRYLFGGDLSPTVYAEYAFGSGDADRLTNTTSSRGGSSFGDDSTFRSFGGLSMGHALAPSLSNIRIVKLGSSVKPFGRVGGARWNDITFQIAYYNYWAAAGGGPTSDPATVSGANATSDKIGDEGDATISWKIFNDVNYQFKFGYFKPGAAYGGSRGSEEYAKLKMSFDL